MKYVKYFLVAGIVAVFVTTTSYTTRTSGLSKGTNPGNIIPDFEIIVDSQNSFKLSDLRGKKILVNLWAAYDANSHMKNVLLWNALQKESLPIQMVSVSFDQSKSIFEKTLRLDGINQESQYIDLKGKDSEIFKKCQLEKGFSNFLIDENGVIIAKNVSPKSLEELFN